MKICLIRPPVLLKPVSVTVKPSPPLGLAYIAGAIRHNNHEVIVIDAVAEAPDKFTSFSKDIVLNGLTHDEIIGLIPIDSDIIGISIMFTCNWLSDRKLIKLIGESFPGIKIIAGGEHITGAPEVSMKQAEHIHVCTLGESEETIIELLDAIENRNPLDIVSGILFMKEGEIIRTAPRSRVKDINKFSYPAWDIFPMENYQKFKLNYGVQTETRSLPVLATRGCPYTCTFCSSPQMWGTRYYMRDPVSMVDELEYFKDKFGVLNFDFYDLTAIINKKWIIKFSKEIINRDLNITWQIPAGTRSEVIDQEVAHYLYKSGCRFITYAPESGSNEILKQIKKKVSLSNMIRSIRYSRKEKLSVKLNIIIGFPEEKHVHIWQTIFFILKASWYGVHDAIPATFTPYVGSELFKKLQQSGEVNLFDDNYYYRIILGDSFFDGYYYNKNISKPILRFYLVLYILLFYGSNYLFRPNRIFRTIRNVITQKFETRGEMGLYDILKRKSLHYASVENK